MPIQFDRRPTRGTLLPLRSLILLAGIAGIMLWGGAQALLGGTSSAASTRQLTVVARDVRFNDSNPPLELKVGEPVALTVVNGEQGIVHDFAIAGLDVRTDGHLSPGASQTLEFTPTKAGTFGYSCTLHPGLMDGQVIVRWH